MVPSKDFYIKIYNRVIISVIKACDKLYLPNTGVPTRVFDMVIFCHNVSAVSSLLKTISKQKNRQNPHKHWILTTSRQ